MTVPRNACRTYGNRATFTANDSGATNYADASVTVCGPITNGFTLGFWWNKNGEAVLCSATPSNDPAWRNLLNSLNLKTKTGGSFTISTTASCKNAYAPFRTFLLGGDAVNMSYMLSVQLSATALDVAFKGMLGSACVAHPATGLPITISALITEAAAWLATHPNTSVSGPDRTLAEQYKTMFDKLNNNLAFAVPCA